MIKQRQDSASQFQNAGRMDLADQENFEIAVLQEYLPPALTEAEIVAIITQTMERLNATSIKDMGRVMNELRPQLQGRADMAVVSQLLKQKLAS